MSLWLPYRMRGKWQLFVVSTSCAIGLIAIACWLLGMAVVVVMVLVRAFSSGGA